MGPERYLGINGGVIFNRINYNSVSQPGVPKLCPEGPRIEHITFLTYWSKNVNRQDFDFYIHFS